MDSLIIIRNDLSRNIDIAMDVSTDLSNSYWGKRTNFVLSGHTEPVAWISRTTGLTDNGVWTFKIPLMITGVNVSLLVKLTGTPTGSNISFGVTTDSDYWAGRDSGEVCVPINGKNGVTIQVIGKEISDGAPFSNIEFTVSEITKVVDKEDVPSGKTSKNANRKILTEIEHMVVLMFENRSFDNIFGYLYGNGKEPAHYIPSENQSPVDGLSGRHFENASYYVRSGVPEYTSCGTTSWPVNGKTIGPTYVPTPDPGEEFERVKNQIGSNQFGSHMSGFLDDYTHNVNANGGPVDSARQIMQSYSPEQLPVISSLARDFAVSDAWHASVPSQTWPNRAFLQAGSSGGNVNNTILPWDFTTIFDVLSKEKISWQVYNNSWLPSLTKTMFFPRYFDNSDHFSGFEDFKKACAAGTLPTFSFIEPSFGPYDHDESYHPPYDVTNGEVFLSRVYDSIQKSPVRDKILFVVLFDEHGGTYDHVEPPMGAQPPNPGPVSTGPENFNFDQFGVRVPAIVISSYVASGTVFRAKSDTPPFDHTSVLATLRDWLGLEEAFAKQLPSQRIKSAPTLADVLDPENPREWPDAPQPNEDDKKALQTRQLPDDTDPLDHNQRAILVAAASLAAGRQFGQSERTEAFDRLKTHGDARVFLSAIKPNMRFDKHLRGAALGVSTA